MTPYVETLESALEHLRIHSWTSYSWYGRRRATPSSALRGPAARTAVREALVAAIHDVLYLDFYCPGYPRPPRRDEPVLSPAHRTLWERQLSAANAGAGCWDQGWEVRRVAEDCIHVEKDGLTLKTRPTGWRPDEPRPVAVGMKVRVRVPRERLAWSPGYYLAQGDAPLVNDRENAVIRLYWNLTPPAIVDWVASATTTLNSDGIGFHLKVLTDPTQLDRCDVGVIYLASADFDPAVQALGSVYLKVANYLRPGTPAFTKALAPGLGVAEGPPDGQSFGRHRCQLVAEGLVCAYAERKRSLTTRMKVVCERFAAAGIDVSMPYLSPGVADQYRAPASVRAWRRSLARADKGVALHTALRIAQHLAKDAVWEEGRCNWVGAVDRRSDGEGSMPFTSRALGPDLYSGASGIGLVLAELSAATGDPDLRSTALGAVEYAVDVASRLSGPAALGLYTGQIGIALAAARVGSLLGRPSLSRRAARLAERCCRARRDDGSPRDFLSGSAGTVIGLLALARVLGDWPDRAAVEIGEDLLQTAESLTAAESSPIHLTGLSHGAAGIAVALLELHAHTGDHRYRRAAEAALHYEQHWFDRDAGNWQDLRPMQPPAGRQQRSFSVAWCHGAPGIALSRMRACELLGHDRVRVEALAGLLSTRRRTEGDLHARTTELSLCHGLGGNALVLRYGAAALGSEFDDADLPEAAAYYVSELCCDRSEALAATHGHLGLMLGLAGLAYFCLRLADPSVPFLLLPRPHDFVVGRPCS